MDEQNITSAQCWSKLLCLAQSANDGSLEKSSQLLSKQDQNFIENAMVEVMHLTDPVKHLTRHIELLKLVGKTNKDEVDSVKEIVDNLEELVCDIDCAIDFCKLGGLVEVIRLLKNGCDPIRCEIARLIPLLAQNNPYVQHMILGTDLLPYLLTILEEINASEDLLTKSLSSLSSIVRTHEEAFSHFCQLKGLEKFEDAFRKAMDTHHFEVANKVVLVTTSIAISLGPDVKQSLVNLMELDKQSKQYLCDFLERQLKHGERFPPEDCLRLLKKIQAALNEDTKNFSSEDSRISIENFGFVLLLFLLKTGCNSSYFYCAKLEEVPIAVKMMSKNNPLRIIDIC
ncbi:Hsp70 nucleotide exchange factor [Dirofilaria immitis]